jgi:hypothetical protein
MLGKCAGYKKECNNKAMWYEYCWDCHDEKQKAEDFVIVPKVIFDILSDLRELEVYRGM